MKPVVKFMVGSQADYDALEIKDNDTVYFIIDTHRIYKGALLFGAGLIDSLIQDGEIQIYGGSAEEVTNGI